MEVVNTEIPGCFELLPKVLRDSRGCFVKTFHSEVFNKYGLRTSWAEEYYSISSQGVLRGLHFQLPPYDHDKIVYCPAGQVLDVVLDLRVGSPSFCRHAQFELNGDKANIIFIPKGCAHGFYTLSDQALMVYKVSTVYAPAADAGVLWSSAGIAWPDDDPKISARDASFPALSHFNSPFNYDEVSL